jgi:hypothetical protein
MHLGQAGRQQVPNRGERVSAKGNDCDLNNESETNLLNEKESMEQVGIGLIGADSRGSMEHEGNPDWEANGFPDMSLARQCFIARKGARRNATFVSG